MGNVKSGEKHRPFDEEYPRNLLFAVRGGWEVDEPTVLTPDVLAGIQYVISLLDEREQQAIRDRFAEHKKLRVVGDGLGVKTERSRQIVNAALRKLRTRRNMSFMTKGIEGHISERCRIAYENGYQVGYNAGYQQGVEDAPQGVSRVGFSVTIVSLPVEALDLSIRSLNALRRAGYETIADLLKVDEKEIIHIKNLGVKQRREVAAGLYRYGVIQTAWDRYRPIATD